MSDWQRPPGPLNRWKVMDGYQKLANGKKKFVKISIQEIPNTDVRKNEVYDFLKTYFLADEARCKSIGIKDDPAGVDCIMSVWKYGLEQGISVGCYTLDSYENIEELIGVTLVYVMTREIFGYLKNMTNNCKSKSYKKILVSDERFYSTVNLFEKLQVDKYINPRAMSINPAYRGQRLGYHLVSEIFPAICKKYGIHAIVALCTAATSQRYAQLADYQEHTTIDYAEFTDSMQNPLFPNIEQKVAKLMIKKIYLDKL